MKYTVKSGDTLSAIARQFYGDPGKYQRIAEANNIKNVNSIQVGAMLTIPELDVDNPSVNLNNQHVSDTNNERVSAEQLKKIIPNIQTQAINTFLAPLNKGMSEAGIDTPLRKAHFLAQLAEESNSFRCLQENLNYSAKALLSVFGKYFPSEKKAKQYERQPESIANRVYADRMGNGGERSGDGWRYRGRGLIQLTGKENYQRCSEACGTDFVSNPESISEEPECAVQVACWYWNSRSLNQYADADDIKAVTLRINGGYNGLKERQAFLTRAKDVFSV